MTASKAEALVIGGQRVEPGTEARFDLPVALLPTHTQLTIPITVLNGRRPGPRLWVSAAVHGDELNGIEVIARVLESLKTPLERGALVAVPVVNVFGFIGQSRYLPDRRDLNRSFPGSTRGSLAGRIAQIFVREVVEHCTHGLDLHTAARDRSNLPQVRGDLTNAETRRMAEAFRAPVMLHSKIRPGSLRAVAKKLGLPVLVYEAGEALRFNENAIDVGVRGVFGVMRELGLVSRSSRKRIPESIALESSSWLRARRGGLLRLIVDEGDMVENKQPLGSIADPLGENRVMLRAPFRGVVIGKTNNPLVHGGDAVLHLGRLSAGTLSVPLSGESEQVHSSTPSEPGMASQSTETRKPTETGKEGGRGPRTSGDA